MGAFASRVVLAVGCVVVVGCGDDSTGTGGGGGTSSTTSSDATTATGSTSSSGNPTAGGGDPGSGGSGAGESGGGGPGSGGAGAGGSGGGDVGGGDTGGGGSGGSEASCCYGSWIPSEPEVASLTSAPVASSGDRLRVRSLEGGGAQLFQGFRDLVLDIDCAFQPAADGVWRCLPSGADVGAGGYFLDDRCTSRAYIENVCTPGEVPAFVSYFEADAPDASCEPYGRFTFHAVEGVVATSTLYYVDNDGGCSAQEILRTVYAVADDPTPAAAFVGGTIETEAIAGPLDLRTMVAADGARQAWGATDETYGPCIADGYADPHCVPWGGYSSDQAYSDATCTTPSSEVTVDRRPEDCAPLAAVRAYDGTTCTYAHFEAEPAEAAYVRDDGACVSADGIPAYTAGTALAASDFPAIDWVGSGPGRLQPLTFAIGDDPIAASSSAWDTELGVACDPFLLDGALRCVPSRRHAVGPVAYADAACSQPLVGGYAQNGCAEMDYYGTEEPGSDCAAAPFIALHRRGDLHVADTVYGVNPDGGACTAFPVPDGVVLYEALEVDPEDLVTLEIALD